MSLELKKRLKSLGWRAGMILVALLISFVIENATLLNVPEYGIVLLGLILGELSKHLQKNGKLDFLPKEMVN